MTPEAPVRSVYQIMKDAGVNLSWYDKAKRLTSTASEVPLDNQRCSLLSIYLMRPDGSLWTVRYGSGEPVAQVRQTEKRPASNTYLCLHCGQLWTGMPTEHREDGDA